MKKISSIREGTAAPSSVIVESASELIADSTESVNETKNLADLRQEFSEEEVSALDYQKDPAGASLVHLEDIVELSDEMIATISELDHVDPKIADRLGSAYELLAGIYEDVDIAHGIVTLGDDGWAAVSDQMTDYQVWGAGETGEGIIGVNEEIDIAKFKRLTSLGLLSPDETTKVSDAFRKLEGGKGVSPTQASIIADAFLRLVGIITGDNNILTSVSKGVKKTTVSEAAIVIVESSKTIGEGSKVEILVEPYAFNPKSTSKHVSTKIDGKKIGTFTMPLEHTKAYIERAKIKVGKTGSVKVTGDL